MPWRPRTIPSRVVFILESCALRWTSTSTSWKSKFCSGPWPQQPQRLRPGMSYCTYPLRIALIARYKQGGAESSRPTSLLNSSDHGLTPCLYNTHIHGHLCQLMFNMFMWNEWTIPCGVVWCGVGWGGSVRPPLSTSEHIITNVKTSGDMSVYMTVTVWHYSYSYICGLNTRLPSLSVSRLSYYIHVYTCCREWQRYIYSDVFLPQSSLTR